VFLSGPVVANPGQLNPRTRNCCIAETFGSDPKKQPYARPTTGAVWEFFGSIAMWLTDPNRRGIPA
jgi:hypothetical protein